MSDPSGASTPHFKTGSNQYAKKQGAPSLPAPPAGPLMEQMNQPPERPERTERINKPQGPATTQTKALGVALQAGVPVMLWGLPGIGKTAVIEDFGELMGAHVETIIGSQYEPSDIAGQPWVVGDHLEHLPPEYAATIAALPPGQMSLLFCDELDKAPPAVSAAMLRLVRERKVAGIALPNTCKIVAAANPPELGGWDLSAPMANRFLHLQWKPTAESIVQGLGTGMWPGVEYTKVDEDELVEARHRWHGLVAGFLSAHGQMAHVMPKEESKQGLAWPSPRTWENLIRLGSYSDAMGQPQTVLAQLVHGSVGEGAGNEFLTFINNLDLPRSEDILKHPDQIDIPDRGDKAAVVCHSLAAAIVEKPTQERIDAAIHYLERVSHGRHRDTVLPAMRTILSVVFNSGKFKIPQEDDVQRLVKSLFDVGLGNRADKK